MYRTIDVHIVHSTAVISAGKYEASNSPEQHMFVKLITDHNIYSLHSFYTISTQYLHSIYTVSSVVMTRQHWPAVAVVTWHLVTSGWARH